MKRDERTYAEIDLSACIENINTYRSLNPNKQILAVVKGDAYGHGSELISHIDRYIDSLGVATVEEGILMRQFTAKPIIIFGYVPEKDYGYLSEYRLTPTIFSCEYAKSLNSYLGSINTTIQANLKINTGMNRLGFKYDNNSDFAYLRGLNHISFNGIYSHYAAADDPVFSELQTNRFILAKSICEKIGYKFDYYHIANSHASLKQAFGNTIRIGYGMYGYGSEKLNPILSWYATVVSAEYINQGDYVGYDKTYCSNSKRKIATLSVGYADGYPRNLSNCGKVIFKNKFLPVVGRICMDMTTVDATETDLEIGDKVCLIGKDGDKIITANELGFGYEILSGISKRVIRFYINSPSTT